MNLSCYNDELRYKNIIVAQQATIEIAEEWAEILEFYMHISKKISFADVYQTYKRINVKIKETITSDDNECLSLMKRAIVILLDVWKYREYLLEVLNELDEKFEPIMDSCNEIFPRIFTNAKYQITSHRIDMMFLLFESDLKIEYKGSLKNELSDIYKQTVNTLINAIDVKDSYTRGHSERVAIISHRFGLMLGLPENELEELIIASKLHDIGKIGVPEDILTKKGFLTPDEYNKIKMHTDFGEKIVKGIPGFESIAETIKYHHERYDGKGYYNLTHNEITTNTYIICLSDSFDTMNSNRSYKERLSFESIIEEYEKCSGSQFEPVLCGKFIEFLKSSIGNLEKIYKH